MSAEQKTTREEPSCVPFKGGLFTAIVEKMMNRCAKMMPQMMAVCGGAKDEKEEETATEAIRQA